MYQSIPAIIPTKPIAITVFGPIRVTSAWASNTLEMVWDGGAWRLAGMTPLASGPAPQTSPPAQSATVEAAAIAGFTPLAP